MSLKDSQTGKVENITTTPEHPFYVLEPDGTQPKPVGHEDLNTHWLGAGHLRIGDTLKTASGGSGQVVLVQTIADSQQMYNLTVDAAHTFYVGKSGWLVHNCPSPTSATIASDTGRHDSLVKYILVQGDLQGLELRTRDQLANFVDDLIANPHTYEKSLSRGRTAYWGPRHDVLVIVDPNAAHAGTVFRPASGIQYFHNLR